jgi:hypothetical protein
VLENYHAALTFLTLKKDKCNFFKGCGMAANDRKLCRKLIIKAILGTDMIHHKEHVHDGERMGNWACQVCERGREGGREGRRRGGERELSSSRLRIQWVFGSSPLFQSPAIPDYKRFNHHRWAFVLRTVLIRVLPL